MTWLRSKLGQAVAFVVAILAVLGVVYRKGVTSERNRNEADDMANAYDRERTRNEIERDGDNSTARDKLHKDWRRD